MPVACATVYFGPTSTCLLYLNVSSNRFPLDEFYSPDTTKGPSISYHRKRLGTLIVMTIQKMSYLATGPDRARHDIVCEALQDDDKGAALFYQKMMFDIVDNPETHYAVWPLLETLKDAFIHVDVDWMHISQPIYLYHPLFHDFEEYGSNAIPSAVVQAWNTSFGSAKPKLEELRESHEQWMARIGQDSMITIPSGTEDFKKFFLAS